MTPTNNYTNEHIQQRRATKSAVQPTIIRSIEIYQLRASDRDNETPPLESNKDHQYRIKTQGLILHTHHRII